MQLKAPNLFLSKIFSELLKFKCAKGCEKIISFKDVDEHYKNCKKKDFKEEYNEYVTQSESEKDDENDESIINNDIINEIIQKLLNFQIPISNLSSQKTIISELKQLSEKLNELFLKNQDLEI